MKGLILNVKAGGEQSQRILRQINDQNLPEWQICGMQNCLGKTVRIAAIDLGMNQVFMKPQTAFVALCKEHEHTHEKPV